MTALDCSAINCGYNNEECCCRSDIDVKGNHANTTDETCCSSFKPVGNGSQNSAGHPHHALSVSCDATHCLFNENELCSAEHISISGVSADYSSDTVCASFACR